MKPIFNNVNKSKETGPFDAIGDVHGCYDELVTLIKKLGYKINEAYLDSTQKAAVTHPEKRRLIFLGDLIDRGPAVPAVLRLAMNVMHTGQGLCVLGNHEAKLLKYLEGRKVQLKHGLEETVSQLKQEPEAFLHQVTTFLQSLRSHYVLDHGRLVVTHAGLKEDYHGKVSPAAHAFALYGDVKGEVDPFGFPIRHDWAASYHGKALVLYGHTPKRDTAWVNNTLCLDTGCVFGGKLTALRYPEREIVSVPANNTYADAERAFC